MLFCYSAIFLAMSHQRIQRLKPLLDAVPPGFLVDTAWLRARGIDPKSIHNYVARGWLARVVRGVYRRPLPEGIRPSRISWEAVVLSLQRLMGCNAHVGGESALDLAGHTHYLPLAGRARVHLHGDAPSWLRRLPTRERFIVRRCALFGGDAAGLDDAEPIVGDNELAVWRWPVRASSPERAILEALDELPGNASFENLDRIFEGLVSLRPKLLMELIAACRSVKVRRLFFVFADRHGHRWRKYLDTDRINFGSGPRALVDGGRFHPTYRISVPEDLMPAKPDTAPANA